MKYQQNAVAILADLIAAAQNDDRFSADGPFVFYNRETDNFYSAASDVFPDRLIGRASEFDPATDYAAFNVDEIPASLIAMWAGYLENEAEKIAENE